MAIRTAPKAPQPASRAVPASEAKKPGERLISAAKQAQAIARGEDEPAAKFDRKAYQRELMRQRRAAEKEAGLVSVKLPGDLVKRWKATGPDWRERMAATLDKALP